MRLRNLAFVCFGFIGQLVRGQVSFVAPDTVCLNEPITIDNNSRNIQYASWNFCEPSSFDDISTENLGYFSGMAVNVHSEMVFDGTNYYQFVTNYLKSNLVRLDFGLSPLNTPKSVDLGNIDKTFPTELEGIRIAKVNNKWYGFLVGGKGVGAKLVRLEFGNDLKNLPTAIDLGNIGSMNWPHGYRLVKDGSNWYGIAASRSNNYISIHNFGKSLTNTPTGSFYRLKSHTSASNVMVVHEGNNWHIFVTCLYGPSLVRLDYGDNLLNSPKEVDLGTLGGALGSLPRALIILRNCDLYFGFVGHENGKVVKIDFRNGIDQNVVATNLGSIHGSTSINNFAPITFQGQLLLFTTNGNSQILRTSFPICSSAIPASDQNEPPVYSYAEAGTEGISLYANAGHYNQSLECENIVVVDKVSPTLGTDTTLCFGDSLLLDVGVENGQYSWQDGSKKPVFLVSNAGKYWVEVSNGWCSTTDTILVEFGPDTSFFGADTILCPGDKLALSIDDLNSSYLWQDGSTNPFFVVSRAGEYWVNVLKQQCTMIDTIDVEYRADISIFGNDTTLCPEEKLTLDIGDLSGSYLWQDGSIESLFSISQAGEYWVQVSDLCIHSDTMLVSYHEIPNLLGKDTVVCQKDGLLLKVDGPFTAYTWSDGSTGKTLDVTESGKVYIEAKSECGIIKDSIFITVDSCTCPVFIANALTPNGDNINEDFKPLSSCTFTEFNMKIFNRWGQLIFESADETIGWNGMRNGLPVQDDVYVCVLNYKFLEQGLLIFRAAAVNVMR